MRFIDFTDSSRKMRRWLRLFIAQPLQRFFRLFTRFPIVLPVWPYFVFFYFPIRQFAKSNNRRGRQAMPKKKKRTGNKKRIRSFTKGKQIGRGGQATVYDGQTPQGETKAIKVYHTVVDRKETLDGILGLIRSGKPSDAFVWPERVFSLKEKGKKGKSIAVQMDLLPDEFEPLSAIVDWECDLTVRTLLQIAINLSLAVEQLHATGKHHCDLSLANVQFHRVTGAVRIIDNENVTADDNKTIGTPGNMAPEIANGTACNSQLTDRMSLAILIFSILVRQNPFHGIKLDSVECRNFRDEFEILSQNPVYIFDPVDRTNPLADGHPSHRLYSVFATLHRAFECSFVTGIRTPADRLSPTAWLQLLNKTMARVTACDCGAENVFSSRSTNCWCCEKKLKIYGVLEVRSPFAKHQLIVCENTSIYPHHTSLKQRFDFSHRLAICRSFNRDRRKPRLHNLSTEDWIVPNTNLRLRSGGSVSLRANFDFFLPTRNVRVSFRRS